MQSSIRDYFALAMIASEMNHTLSEDTEEIKPAKYLKLKQGQFLFEILDTGEVRKIDVTEYQLPLYSNMVLARSLNSAKNKFKKKQL